MKRLLLSATSVALFASPAYGQDRVNGKSDNAVVNDEIIIVHDANQSEIISVGQRHDSSYRRQLTSPASIINTYGVTARGQSYVSDMLKSLPGLSVNRSGGAGSLTQIRMRGAEANHTLVLIDGVEVSDPTTGEFDFGSLGALDIYKIEVLRGEQSALYGSDAIGGVINIITNASPAPGASSQWGERNKVYASAGNFNTIELAGHSVIDIDGDENKHWHERTALSLSANLRHSDGYDISGLGDEKDANKRMTARIGINRLRMGSTIIATNASWSKTKNQFDNDIDFDGRLNNTADELTTENFNGRIQTSFEWGEIDLNDIEHRMSLSYADTSSRNPFAAFINDTDGSRFKFDWVGKVQHWDNPSSLTVLAEIEQEKFSQFGGTGAPQNQKESLQKGAIAADFKYEDDGFHGYSNHTITASTRLDINERFADTLTWRLGANIALDNETKHRVRASIGTGVKHPSMTEIFGFFPASFVGNPDIEPETSLGFNLGYGYDLDTFGVAFDYFRSQLKNEIMTDFSVFPNTVRNLQTNSTRQGIEVEGRWAPIKDVFLNGTATFLDTSENGISELRRPKLTASATLKWFVVDGFTVTAFADYTGAQFDTDFATFSRVELDAFTLIGLNARWRVKDGVVLSLRGENLLDEDYQEVVGYHSQGRGVYAGISADF